MAHVGGAVGAWRRAPAPLRSRVVGLCLLGLLGIVVLNVASGGPDRLRAWHITMAFLLFAGTLIVGRYLTATASKTDSKPYLVDYQLVLLVGLVGITYQSRTPGYGLGLYRPLDVVAVFAALVAFCVLAGDPRRYDGDQWLVIACFATVVGIFFYHSLGIPAASLRSRHPVWAGIVMGIGLVVLPQYLSTEQFCWAVARLAAAAVAVAVPVYAVGGYSLYGLAVAFHDGYTVPVVEYRIRATRSLFVNRNAFATVVFGGLVAALAGLHHSVVRGQTPMAVVVPALLVGLNAFGLAIAFGKALWVVTPMALGIYGLYLLVGRRAVPIAVLLSGAYLVVGIYAVYTGIPDVHPSGRFRLWGASIRAILADRSLLGAGLVPPAELIADHGGGGASPHNSYLSIWLRTGIVGGLAYLVLIAGSVLRGMYRYRTVDVAVLAMAVGYAGHHLFEAYTMFRWGSGAVLVTLVFGMLVFGERGADSTTRDRQTLERPTTYVTESEHD